jgi:hypothetical protein
VTHKVAVIGAGLAGLSCARVLRRAGCFVEVFEQDKNIAGRVATTRAGLVSFDAGAQYLTARSAPFRAYIDELVAGGYASRWTPKSTAGEKQGVQLHPWYVGTPGMSAIVRPLTESVRIHTSRRVHTVSQTDKGWVLVFDDETNAGPFSAVAVAVPAPAAQLLLGRVEGIVEALARVRISPCWAVMACFEAQVLPDQDVYSDMSEVIRWIARNSSKPGRSGKGETIVIHASPGWTRDAEDADPEAVGEELWKEAANVLGLAPAQPALMMAHLWRYGLVDQHLGESFVYSTHYRVGAAGDWCLGRLAEHAFESGQALGRAIVNSLT